MSDNQRRKSTVFEMPHFDPHEILRNATAPTSVCDFKQTTTTTRTTRESPKAKKVRVVKAKSTTTRTKQKGRTVTTTTVTTTEKQKSITLGNVVETKDETTTTTIKTEQQQQFEEVVAQTKRKTKRKHGEWKEDLAKHEQLAGELAEMDIMAAVQARCEMSHAQM
jgi:hypothetical protein